METESVMVTSETGDDVIVIDTSTESEGHSFALNGWMPNGVHTLSQYALFSCRLTLRTVKHLVSHSGVRSVDQPHSGSGNGVMTGGDETDVVTFTVFEGQSFALNG